jgi:hypothetical protein
MLEKSSYPENMEQTENIAVTEWLGGGDVRGAFASIRKGRAKANGSRKLRELSLDLNLPIEPAPWRPNPADLTQVIPRSPRPV